MSASDVATLANAHHALRIAADAERLNLLDDLWTPYAEIRGSIKRLDDGGDLRVLVGEMDGLLRALQSEAPRLKQTVEALGNEAVDAMLHGLLTASQQGEQLRSVWDRRLAGNSFAAAGIEACRALADEVPAEIEGLRANLDLMLEGLATTGDLELPLKCKLTLIAALGAVASATILGILAGLALGVPVLGGVCGALGGLAAATFAIASNCPDEVLELILPKGSRRPQTL